MICPVCDSAELITDKGKYYCPACKLYVGSTEEGSAPSNPENINSSAPQSEEVRGSSYPSYKMAIHNHLEAERATQEVPLGIDIIAMLLDISGVGTILAIYYDIFLIIIDPVLGILSTLLFLAVGISVITTATGLRRLRTWGLVAFIVEQIIGLILSAVEIGIDINANTTNTSGKVLLYCIGALISILLIIYVLNKRSMFMTKGEAEKQQISFHNPIPRWVGFAIVISFFILGFVLAFITQEEILSNMH